MGKEFIKLTGIVKSFAGVQALQDVDFTMCEGEIRCLAGENGSGKSTLVQALTGENPDRLAEEKHREQKRSSGEPYIIHPLSVAAILVGLGMDSQSVMAGLLHDVVEDTDCTLEDIQKQFGKEVALLIDGVTKLGKIPYSSREEQQAENLRKMLMAMAEDIRVIIIKFADRMHNLATLEYMSPQKQRDKAVECLEAAGCSAADRRRRTRSGLRFPPMIWRIFSPLCPVWKKDA